MEGVERKINEVVSSVERAQANYMINKAVHNNYQPNYPYGGVPNVYYPRHPSRNLNPAPPLVIRANS